MFWTSRSRYAGSLLGNRRQASTLKLVQRAEGGPSDGADVGRLACELGEVRLRAQQGKHGLVNRHGWEAPVRPAPRAGLPISPTGRPSTQMAAFDPLLRSHFHARWPTP